MSHIIPVFVSSHTPIQLLQYTPLSLRFHCISPSFSPSFHTRQGLRFATYDSSSIVHARSSAVMTLNFFQWKHSCVLRNTLHYCMHPRRSSTFPVTKARKTSQRASKNMLTLTLQRKMICLGCTMHSVCAAGMIFAIF